MNPTLNCSDDILRLLLQEDEQSGDYRDAARHVDSCPHCQQRIGELAAEDDEWHEAHEMLLVGDESGSGNIDSVSGHERSRRRWQRRPTAWTETMARQLLSPPSHPEMLGRIGRYEVERLIGTGGMGVVFKAFDSELNRPVAVKLLTPFLAGSGAARKRFAREARAAAAIVHEHVVAIHNVETDGQVPFLVMRYVAGESLQGRLDREGPLGMCEALRIGLQIASGLAAAHAQGLVHRDVKPSNVLLEKGVERSLLTDFGLARAGDDAGLTVTGHHPGTPQYMSPEQARGEALDGRSDLFSLGCVLCEMATGVSPFRTDSTLATLRRIVDEQPAAMASLVPELPPWFSHIVERLRSKDPAQRFASASEVSQLLEQCLSHLQQPTSVPLPASLVPHAADRRSIFSRHPFRQASRTSTSSEHNMTLEQSPSEPTSSRNNAVMICGCLLGLVSAVALAAGGIMCESILKVLMTRATQNGQALHPWADLGSQMLRLSWAPLGVAAGMVLTLAGLQQAKHRSGRSKLVSLLLLVTAITACLAAFEMKKSVRQTQTAMEVRSMEARSYRQTRDEEEEAPDRSVPKATRCWLLLALSQATLAAAAITQVMSHRQPSPQSPNRSNEDLAVTVLVGLFGVIVSWSWFSNGLAIERTRNQNVIKAAELVGQISHVLSSTDWGALALMASMSVLAITTVMSSSRRLISSESSSPT